MRAVRIVAPHSPLVDADLPEPQSGDVEVRIDIRACGICRSDAHYRAGFGNAPLPRTPGHEIAGVVSAVGPHVTDLAIGDRVAVHYLLSCKTCDACRESGEAFCERGAMIGKHVDGGYAESIVVPAWNAIPIPPSLSFEVAALMMCSTATAYHALRAGGMAAGKRVAIVGFGGLGVSALELALALGAKSVTALDVVPEKLARAKALGATDSDVFDLALDFAGDPETAVAALRRLAPKGTLVLVALADAPLLFDPYRDVLARERRIAGCSDHLREELFELMELAARGAIHIERAISRRVPLDAASIDPVLDELERGTSALRTVIVQNASFT